MSNIHTKHCLWWLLLVSALLLAACGGSSSSSKRLDPPLAADEDTKQTPGADEEEDEIPTSEGRVFKITRGASATRDMVNAMIQLKPGDTLEFDCGFFELDQGLLIQATEDVHIKGCGMNETVLSFRNSANVTGLEALNVRGVTVSDLTIADSPGDAFKLKGVKWGTLRNVRAIWSGGAKEPISAHNYKDRIEVACTAPPLSKGDPTPDYIPSSSSGRYGIYPVESENILVENSESIGASDAGIYVGQTNNAIIRTSRAAYNVMGFEIENVRNGEYDQNTAECNTGGFLIYDLENITQYGDSSVMLNNLARNNNTYNFGQSGLVAMVPRGVGFITLGYDNIEMYKNTFEDHATAAVLYISYELIDGKRGTGDKKLDPYTEGFHMYDNVMRNSGYDLSMPELDKIAEGDITTLLPFLIGIKNLPELELTKPLSTLQSLKNLLNLGKGAHIIWDGLLDELDEGCPYPEDAQGNPVPKDENGKPLHTHEHPNPKCHYNAYKFDEQGKRKLPEWGSCFHNNKFEGKGIPYLNFHGTSGMELVELLVDQNFSKLLEVLPGLVNFGADTKLEDHDCEARFGKLLPSIKRVKIPPFERSGTIEPALDEEYVNALCEAPVKEGEINRAALAVDCPLLKQYNLFEDEDNPRSMPHEGGVPFVVNTKLFADYSTKYRVLFLPPNEKAIYKDGQEGSAPNSTIEFPIGTVIAKTFAFTNEAEGTERMIETRLLIKRPGQTGKGVWVGLPYIWDEDGVARLAMGGGKFAVEWHYRDTDSGVLLSGSTESYSVPNANQCITCHGNDDQPSGSAPIAPKPRNLNRVYRPESSFMGNKGQGGFPQVNQLQYWVDNGLLAAAPTLEINSRGIATNVERLPIWNLPGDGKHEANTKADVEERLRAYLEVNCQYCHNDKGAASNTGYYLDHFREVGASYGICKKPTATGGGSCGRDRIVVPGSSEKSIVTCRVEAGHDEPQRMMPPIARSVSHAGAVALLRSWINEVVDSSYTNASFCD